MPIAKVQLPDGRIGRFEVPEGTTPEQVTEFAAQNLDSLGGGSPQQQPEPQTQPQEPSFLEQAGRGVGLAARSLTKGAAALPLIAGDALNAGVNLATSGINAALGTEIPQLGSASQSFEELQTKAGLPTPQTPTERVAGSVGEFLGGAGTGIGAGRALSKSANAVTRGVGDTLAAKPVEQAVGAVTGGAAQGLAREGGVGEVGQVAAGIAGSLAPGGISAAARSTLPNVDDNVAVLAKKAKDYDIPLSLNQLKPSSVRNTVEKISRPIPFSGADDFIATQRQNWNKAVAEKTLGNGITDTTPDSIVKWANANSTKFDSALKDTKVNLFRDDITALNEQKAYLQQNSSPLSFRRINSKLDAVLKDIEGQFLEGDQIVGVNAQKISNLRSELLRQSVKAQGQEKYVLSEMVDFANDILEKSLSNSKLKTLQEARREYRNYKILQPLLEKSPTGEINPTDLSARVASNPYITASKIKTGEDPIVDLARIGKQFLPIKGGSDTAEKLTYLTGTGLTGAVIGLPQTAALIAGNRAYQSLYNQNKNLVGKALEKGANPITLNAPIGSIAASTNADKEPVGFNALTTKQRIEEIRRRRQNPGVNPNADLIERVKAIRAKRQQDRQNIAPQSSNEGGYDFFERKKQAESGGDPNAQAKTSSASGLYGFTNATWRNAVKKWGAETGIQYKDKNNPQAQEVMVRKLADDNYDIIKPRLGREPTNGEMYIAHFLGASQAVRLIRNKDQNKTAANLFPKEAAANRSIFYEKDGSPRTTSQVYQLLKNKVA